MLNVMDDVGGMGDKGDWEVSKVSASRASINGGSPNCFSSTDMRPRCPLRQIPELANTSVILSLMCSSVAV